MGAREKSEVDCRFISRDDSSIKVFDAPPSKSLVDDLRDYVRREGTPDLWQWHLHTKPPKGIAPQIIAKDITVPESLRSQVGKAPCPICSLGGPKYFSGMLAWFPEENALRVIGHECGVRYFDAGLFRKALDQFDSRKAKEATENFLFANLLKVKIARAAILLLGPAARESDLLRRKIRKALTQVRATAICRHAKGTNRLALFEMQLASSVSRNGELEEYLKPVEVASFPISGLGVLRAKAVSAEALLYRASEALEGREVEDEDQLLDLMLRLGTYGCEQTELALKDAWRSIEEVTASIRETRVFVERQNILNIADWAADKRSSVQFHCRLDSYGRLLIGDTRASPRRVIPINLGLLDIKVAIPPLEF